MKIKLTHADQIISQFIEKAMAALAAENEFVLLLCGSKSAWAATYVQKPVDMDYSDYSAYCDIVGDELVACGILKVDNRRHKGMAHNPNRMRVSQSWWRKAHADSD